MILAILAVANAIGPVFHVPSHAAGAAATAPEHQVPLPAFSTIEKIVHDHFRKNHIDRRALLSRGEVQPLFAQFEKAGWKVEDEKDILDHVLADNDFMVQQLRTPQGRQFAAQIARYPEGYDRADRLRRLPRGERFLSDMVRGPDGYKLIEYMTMSPYGYNMGLMLSDTPDGRDFNQPTGRIYTSDQFLKRLRESYDRAEKKQREIQHGG